MKLLTLLHRWTGGFVGLILALLGLSGAILVHKDAWVSLPHAGDAQVTDTQVIARAVDRLMRDPAHRPESIGFARESFGLDRLTFAHGAGAYADQSGHIVTRWDSVWERPELWLFDFHHHLFAGETGDIVIGVAALCGLFFVISGAVLWWRTRRTFAFRLWPKRLSRTAIVRQHRDLGMVVAPLLLLSLYTGASMIFRPVSALVLGPSAPATIQAAAKPPQYRTAEVAPDLDWAKLMQTAHARFPDAEIRVLALPKRGSGLITLRMRQPAEWLPNGRTMVYFAADTGTLVEARDALKQPRPVRGFNLFFPLHAASVGGLAYRLLMTVSGLALALLGSFAVWSFWFMGKSARPLARPRGGVSD